MHMPAENRRPAHLARLVSEGDAIFPIGTILATDVPVAARIAGAAVVVAADQKDFDLVAGFPPDADGLECRVGCVHFAVKEITQDDQAVRAGFLQQFGQRKQIVCGGSDGHRHPALAKHRRLAEVKISDDQRLLSRPIDCFQRAEHPVLIRKFD